MISNRTIRFATYTLIVGVMSIFTIFGCVTTMPGRSHRGALPALTEHENELKQRLSLHVRKLAGDIGERNMPRLEALEAAASYLTQAFEAVGYQPSAQEFKVSGRTVKNVEAELRGNARADEVVLIGAHYDSVFGSPGANDNATGVAGVLELARLVKTARLDRTIRFVCFVNEEPPYFRSEDMGSWHYAKRCRDQHENVVAMLSLETIGYYSDRKGSQQYPMPFGLLYPDTGNFIGFVGSPKSKDLLFRCVGSFRQHTQFPSEGIAAPSWVNGIDWSDHACFWSRGYPALMITDTAPFRYPYYHSREDTPDKVDYARTARVVAGIGRVAAELASTPKQ